MLNLKYLYLEIRTETPYGEPKFQEDVSIAFDNLKDIIRVLLHINIKLKTLRVCYSSHFQGQLEGVFRGPNQSIPGTPDGQIIVDKWRTRYCVQIDHNSTISIAKGGYSREMSPFKLARVLDPLIDLKGT